jgi:hypothetical protein
VTTGAGGARPSGNTVVGNAILRNDPDLFWDGSGSNNRLSPNVCRRSIPAGLCQRA